MDKYEYRIRAEEINALIEQKEYAQAVKIADTIDWRRVRSVVMLCKVSELYKMNRRYEDSKEVLLLAYDLQPSSRKIVYSLCELSIKLEETVQAVEYYKEFIQIAPRDTGRFILQYRLYEAQDVSLEERIAVLEEYKKRDYREKWSYELAYLYHRIGLATRCVEECDELILWFGEGKYVVKALELKMLHAPLTPQQQEKYNARFMVPAQETLANTESEEPSASEEIEPSLSIEIKSVEATRAKTAKIPSKEVNEEIEDTEDIPDEMDEDQEESQSEEENLTAYDTDTYEVDDSAEDMENDLNEKEVQEEDSDMKIVNPNEDLDIHVKTIDVGDEYSTINLQEALAKNIAEMLAQEDMEATDATKALPVESIFKATTQNLPKAEIEQADDVKEFANNEEIAAQELKVEDTAEEEVDEIDEAENEDIEAEEKESDEKDAPDAILKAVTRELTLNEEETAAFDEEETEETEEVEEVEELEQPEETVVSEEEQETEEQLQNTEELEEVEEIEEVEEVEEIDEVAEEVSSEADEIHEIHAVEEKQEEKEPEIEPLVFGKNTPLPQALIEAVQAAAIEAAKEAAKQAAQEAAHATVEAIKEIKPEIMETSSSRKEMDSEQEEVSAKETVVEEKAESESDDMVDKQITGQLSFTDIMAEWEETKKANEEKHLEEMRQRVLEQTGPLLSDFDAAARASVQSDLDMISPILDVFSDTDDLASEVENALQDEGSEDIEIEDENQENISEDENQDDAEYEQAAEALAEKDEALDETSPEEEKMPEATEETGVEDTLADRPSSFNTAEINGLEEKLMSALGGQHYDTASIPAHILEEEMAEEESNQETEQVVDATVSENEQIQAEKSIEYSAENSSSSEMIPDSGEITSRTLTKAEREIFGPIAQTKELQEQIAYALDTISLVPYTGNIIVTGENGTGTLETAQNIVNDLSASNDSFSGKSETYTSEELASKDMDALVSSLSNGALIIEKAGDLSVDICNKLLKACNDLKGQGIVIILVDTKQDIERLVRGYQKITEYFNARIDIVALDNDGLVNFGKEYAKEQEYSIDDMGVLALYNRIEERQTNEHAVTVVEVKDIVNEAIQKASKKNVSHFMDVIFAKRYDKEDMIVLREKDFLN